MSFDLAIGDDQRQILDAAQSMLDSHYPLDRLRNPAFTDPVEPLADFGTFVLAVPEDQGGAGFSVVEEALLHAALGRHLMSTSSFAAAVGLRVALETGREELAAAIATGKAKVCAGTEARGGTLLFDPNEAVAALIRCSAGFRLVSLDGAHSVAESAMGHGRPIARLARDRPVSNDAPAGEAVLYLANVLAAAQLLGIATGARDLAVGYSRIREQFGRPIGSFQAIKHHCANMTIGVEMLSAQLDMAAIALRDGREDAAFQLAALARLAPAIALRNARLGIQIHGGIGFSAEAHAQLYVKHAHLLGALMHEADLLSQPAPLAPIREN